MRITVHSSSNLTDPTNDALFLLNSPAGAAAKGGAAGAAVSSFEL